MIKQIYEKTISGQELNEIDTELVLKAPLKELVEYANKLKERMHGRGIDTCAIINARSGLCSEDCTFCAQSSHYKTDAPVYPYLNLEKIDAASKVMADKGVERFSIVTSGIGPNEEEFEMLKNSVQIIASYGLVADASVGILTKDQLIELKNCGLAGYHHNLETARSYFPKICTTHSYDDDVQAVTDAVGAGLYVCSGGIFGIGEHWGHRTEFARELKSLKVHSVPVNFLTAIPGTPLEGTPKLSAEEALRIVALFRFILPEAHIRVCGGRNLVFPGDDSLKLMSAGITGLMVGDYLTQKGEGIDEDMINIHRHESERK
jgi:biotin synthase